MKLLSAKTLELKSYVDLPEQPYAILSHTWGTEEATFQDWTSSKYKVQHLNGYNKIAEFCRLAREVYNLDLGWVDTCCIDKSSSAELSEAINSMYRYYEKSNVCIVYLVDVAAEYEAVTAPTGGRTVEAICRSRWFTRGWTLQELLAPESFVFYGASWNRLGTIAESKMLARRVSERTGIDIAVLEKSEPASERSIATRLSWASDRVTSRLEDEAYCLLGLFDISLPTLYGEGRRAFMHLQEEIIRRSSDQSIFVWQTPRGERPRKDLLASSPSCFAFLRNKKVSSHIRYGSNHPESFDLSNVGLRTRLNVASCPSNLETYHILLNCQISSEGSSRSVALNLAHWHPGPPPMGLSGDKKKETEVLPFYRTNILSNHLNSGDDCFFDHDGTLAYLPEDRPLYNAPLRSITIARHARAKPDIPGNKTTWKFSELGARITMNIKQSSLPHRLLKKRAANPPNEDPAGELIALPGLATVTLDGSNTDPNATLTIALYLVTSQDDHSMSVGCVVLECDASTWTDPYSSLIKRNHHQNVCPLEEGVVAPYVLTKTLGLEISVEDTSIKARSFVSFHVDIAVCREDFTSQSSSVPVEANTIARLPIGKVNLLVDLNIDSEHPRRYYVSDTDSG